MEPRKITPVDIDFEDRNKLLRRQAAAPRGLTGSQRFRIAAAQMERVSTTPEAKRVFEIVADLSRQPK